MPELPEVETTRRGIEPHVVNNKIIKVEIRQPSLRWPIPKNLSELIEQSAVTELVRRGKYILFHFANGTMLLHLGMSGSLRLIEENCPPGKHDHVDFCFANGKTLRYNDPRRFGAILWTDEAVQDHELLIHLGPEPLLDEFTADYLFEKSRKKKIAVKNFIMDSKVVVGVGNIYANEALFLAGIKPAAIAGKISKAKYQLLVENIKLILLQAIKQGGTTLRNFVGGDGKPGYFKQELKVYGRAGEACVHCAKPLKEIRLGQRSTVYCTKCQS